jgi:SPX domain protein involved in polyphosphate accumulation
VVLKPTRKETLGTVLDTPRLIVQKFKNKNSGGLLAYFLNINKTLLQSLLFQEMNFTAIQKILKKFDKRTSLSCVSIY